MQANQSVQIYEIAKKEEPRSSEFLTTTQAAKRLGLSVATIQNMVRGKSLQAWVTPGGHRRIYLESILNLDKSNYLNKKTYEASKKIYQVCMVVESPRLFKHLSQKTHEWQLPLKFSIFDSLNEALLDLISQKQDLFIIEMNSPRAQQIKILKVLRKFMDSEKTLSHILIFTPETDLLPPVVPESTGGKIQVVNNFLSPFWLSGYLTGFVTELKN